MPEPQSGALTTSPYSPWQGRQDSNPRHAVLETAVLPAELRPYFRTGRTPVHRRGVVVEGVGFEPTKHYATDLQSAPFGHFGTPPKLGASDRNRTCDLLITSQLLYLLSYAGAATRRNVAHPRASCQRLFLPCEDEIPSIRTPRRRRRRLYVSGACSFKCSVTARIGVNVEMACL